MRFQGVREERGVTLLELTIAVAVFAVVLGAAATTLVSFHVAMDLQNQRAVGIQHCRSVLSQIREVRNNNPTNFPGAVLAQWPDGSSVAALASLPQEQLVVGYTNTNANPLEVTVTCMWRDLRGRPAMLSVSTLLTDR